MENFSSKIEEVLKDAESRLRRLTFFSFVFHFFTSMETLLGLTMDCVIKLHAVAAEFTDMPYEEKREAIVAWINKRVNVPGPNEAQEAVLLGSVFDMAVSWFEKHVPGIVTWGAPKPPTPTEVEPAVDISAYVANRFHPYAEWLKH